MCGPVTELVPQTAEKMQSSGFKYDSVSQGLLDVGGMVSMVCAATCKRTVWYCNLLCRPPGAPAAPDVEVTLTPEELEGLDNEGIRALYEAKVAAAQAAAKAEREDFSDLVAGHAAAQKRKAAARADSRAAKKQKETFKF